jgi:MoxR-like ATPase
LYLTLDVGKIAKRALEVAAGGGHNLLMIGPPGAGKSMLAARLPSILPPLLPTELLEVSMIASATGDIEGGALTNRRPFRSPHHSASMPALVGGGLRARPGEISLAHNGVLFLDEMPEFAAQVLDSLRQAVRNRRRRHRARLSPRLARRPHASRSRRRRECRPRAFGRGAILPRARRRSAARGVKAHYFRAI